MIDKICSSGKFPPIMVLFGEEDLLVEEDAARLYEAACKGDATGMNCDVLDGEGMTLDAVLSLARSFPMMSDRRVIWVRRADKLTASKSRKGGDAMQNYLDAPSESTFLLLTATLASAAGLGAALTKNAATAKRKLSSLKYPFNVLLPDVPFVEYARMKEGQLGTWITKRAASMGLQLPQGATELLVAKTGVALRELTMEIEKLQAYMGDRTEVTLDDVQAIVGSSREFNVFELQRAIGRAEPARAMTIIARMLSVDRQEMLILAMLSRYFIALYRLIDLRGSTDSSEIARQAKIPPFAVGEHFDALDRIGAARVERGLRALQTAEATLKSTSADPLAVLQRMIADVFEVEDKR